MNAKKVMLIIPLIISLLSIGYSIESNVSPYFGYHYMDKTKNLNNSWEIGAYYTDKLSERLFIDYNLGFVISSIKSSGENTLLLGGGINVLYTFSKIEQITPFVLAGIGGVGGYSARAGLDFGVGCFIEINDSLSPRVEITNIYYGETLGSDTIVQIILAMPLAKNENTVVPEVVQPIAAEVKETINPSITNELEKVFLKTGKIEKMNMKINFDSGTSVVKSKYAISLQKYAQLLLAHPEIKLLIKGYTDNRGNKNSNLKLSELRAKSIANVLIYKYGINKTRIKIQGFGGANPVATNKTEAGRALNRRIEASTL